MGLFDKFNQFIASIRLSEKSLNNTTQDKPKIRNKKSVGNSSSKSKQESNTLGIDISSVLNDPKIKNILVAHANKTCSTIENVPQQYRDKVAEAVLNNFYGSLPDGQTLLAELQSIYQIPKKEALLIARDQTSKLTARLNQARQEAIGITEYIWRTANTQCNHSERNGKKFRWNTPPIDGHPGQPHLCSCYAEAVIDPQKIVRAARKR